MFASNPKGDKHRREQDQNLILGDKEIQSLWEHSDLPAVAAILIMLHTGLRIQEYYAIKPEDINMTAKVIKLNGNSIKINRTIPIPDKILPLIKCKEQNVLMPMSKASENSHSIEYFKYTLIRTLAIYTNISNIYTIRHTYLINTYLNRNNERR